MNPVEVIEQARRRLARVSALRSALLGIAPAITALILAAVLSPLNRLMLDYWGYSLGAVHLPMIRIGLIVAAAAALATAGLAALRACRRDENFLAAAREVDSIANARLEVLTMAEIANPELSEAQRLASRTPLFAMLWRRAIAHLESFNPRESFPLRLGPPLGRSSLISLAVVIALGLAMLALAQPPTPGQRAALQLRVLAEGLSGNAALAGQVRAAAAALANPELPKREKMRILSELQTKIDRVRQSQGKGKKTSGGTSGGKSASAASSAAGNGKGQGAGSGGTGSGGKGNGGKGKGSGASSAGNSKGATANQPSNSESGKKLAALEATLNQAKSRIAQENGPKNQPAPSPSNQARNGNAPKPGQNPNLPGSGNRQNPAAPQSQPTPGNLGHNQKPGAEGSRTQGKSSPMGDTQFGEFPKPEKGLKRYYAGGGKGPAVAVKDARFVVFKIPAATVSSGGRTVIDKKSPRATTPYTNAPLAQTELNTTPDERQLVPPRYRDLIR